METYFTVMFGDVRHERSLILLLSLTHPDILRQSKFTDHEIDFIKNLALEKLHIQRILKKQVAIALLESHLLLKIKTKDVQLRELQYKTEKHDYESLLKTLKSDSDYYKKKYKCLNKKNVIIIVRESLLFLVGLTVSSGLTVSGLAPVGIMCASTISFLLSIRTIITNEFFSKIKVLYVLN